MTTTPNRTSPMEATDALRTLAREVEGRAQGRAELAHFAAWVRTRLDVLAESLTPAHRSRTSSAKATRRIDSTLN